MSIYYKRFVCSTQDINEKLGFFQKQFGLTGNEVRLVAAKKPKLITYDLQKIRRSIFSVKEEMGFTAEETKKILLKKPGIFMKSNDKFLQTFCCLILFFFCRS